MAQLREEYDHRRIACSVVVLGGATGADVSSGTRKASVERAVHQPLQWEIDLGGSSSTSSSGSGGGTGSSGGSLEQLSTDAKAVVHALLSPHPLSHYPESDTSSTTKTIPAAGGNTPTTSKQSSGRSGVRSSSSSDSEDKLVYVRVYNPVRTYLKRLLQETFHVPFGDEEADADCVPATARRYDEDYVRASTQGKKRCATVGVEYFSVKLPESAVRWVVDEWVPADVKEYVFARGVVEVEEV